MRSVDWEGGISTLVCVHAGLNPAAPLQAQLRALSERDMSDPVLYAGSSSRTGEATAGKQLEDGCTLSDTAPCVHNMDCLSL